MWPRANTETYSELLIIECSEKRSVAPVGLQFCSYDYFNFDVNGSCPWQSSGSRPAKRRVFRCSGFAYQGDGDLAAISTAESYRSGTRKHFSVFFVNNATYG